MSLRSKPLWPAIPGGHPVVLVLSISLFSLALAGCSSTPKAPAVHPGLSVFDKAIGLPANPHSIVREGDQVTYVVTSPDEQFIYARFDASCSQGLASMRFPTTMGMVPFSGGLRQAIPYRRLSFSNS
ncbi:hypothetical protein [Pseudomonas peli]|uniref:hypothetical protein n=1 Tax=Pseudomonas peli TaxID=592361 RepID=UPI0024AD9156|nr:hypothetical protein [Pseudomonas peli]